MTSNSLRFLTANQVKRIHALGIANNPPTQPSLLESAVQSPININYYEKEERFTTLAAILSGKVMKNHTFGDGNKRTGLISADMFLRLNGLRLVPSLYTRKDMENKRLEESLVKVVRHERTSHELGEELGLIVRKCDMFPRDSAKSRS